VEASGENLVRGIVRREGIRFDSGGPSIGEQVRDDVLFAFEVLGGKYVGAVS
jgi:hypothetical protein